MELDLSRPRGVGDILRTCGGLYRSRFRLFATIALAVVIPLDVASFALGGQALWDFGADLSTTGRTASWIATTFMPGLITAGHVVAVNDIGQAREPSAARALRESARRIVPVVLGLIVTGFVVPFALLLFVAPGVYLFVRWYVAPQAVVVERLGAIEGLIRSGELVKGSWPWVFRAAAVLFLISLVPSVAIGLPVAELAGGDSVAALLAAVLVNAVSLSFTALGSTLVYFSLRARGR